LLLDKDGKPGWCRTPTATADFQQARWLLLLLAVADAVIAARVCRQLDVESVFLKMALDVVDGEPLLVHQLKNPFGCSSLWTTQLIHCLHKLVMELWGPPQAGF
jgi:hypothetical protein